MGEVVNANGVRDKNIARHPVKLLSKFCGNDQFSQHALKGSILNYLCMGFSLINASELIIIPEAD